MVFGKDLYKAKIKNVEDKIPPTTNLANKSTLNAKLNNVKCERPNITNFATYASVNAKINAFKGEIPNITNLATTSALTAAENKIPSFRNLVKKLLLSIFIISRKLMKLKKKKNPDNNHDKYITTPEFNAFTAEIFDLRLKRANLASKSDITNFVKKTDFDNKQKDVTTNKNELNERSQKIKARSTKGLAKDLIDKFSTLNGATYFSSGIFENYLVFIIAKNTLNILLALLGLNRGNLMVCQKKILKI